MRFLLPVCALLSAGLLSGPADARDRGLRRQQQQQQEQREERREDRREDRREERREERREDRDRSGDAARQAQMRNGGGRVLSVEPEGAGYRVKVLKDGEVRVHHVEGN
jgi:hypothetical protein